MLFKGTADALGRGHRAGDRLDRRPAGRVHREGVRELLHQGARRAPAARLDVLSRHRAAIRRSTRDDIEREKKVVLEEIKMVEDTPDDLVHEMFTQASGRAIRSAGRFSARRRPSSRSTRPALRDYFDSTYTAPQPDHCRRSATRARAPARPGRPTRSARCRPTATRPTRSRRASCRRCWSGNKDLEQSHVCLGTSSYPQNHDDRYASYVLNTMLGGSMSSRLFQNIREKRGLAYAVFSSLSAYRDAGSLTVYAGCANEAVGEVIDLVVDELRGMKQPLPDAELRRAKDHLKGSLMLSLESTVEPHVASGPAGDLLRSPVQPRRNARGHRARDADDVQRVGCCRRVAAATVLGRNGLQLARRLDARATRGRDGFRGYRALSASRTCSPRDAACQ